MEMPTMGEGTLLLNDRDKDAQRWNEKYLINCCCCTSVRRWSSIPCSERGCHILSTLANIASLIITCVDLSQFPHDSDDFILGWAIFFTTGVCIFYILYGVIMKAHLPSYIAYSVNLIILLIYSAVSYNYNKTDLEDLARLGIVASLCVVPLVSLASAMWKHAAWRKVAFHQSCDPEDQRMLNSRTL
ncbi:uncharacterized protein LOC135397682 [Ornithodoros turicata]|uniref:uncharacterized protein LOC135397682 n=1 Tax=Ornithodoros turicata TaxID=34597 RepID=UPI003138CC9C